MAMSTFTSINFYLGLEINEILDYAIIIEDINKKQTP